MSFVPLHVHSHYSLLDGLPKPHQISKRCAQLGYNACAISDHGVLSGAIQFIKACKEACVCGEPKKGHENNKGKARCGNGCQEFRPAKIKPIIGSEFYLTPHKDKDKNNRKLSHLVVLARDLDGWKSLIDLTSFANSEERFYYKPRLLLEDYASRSKQGSLVCFSGHMGSDLANVLFANISLAYNAKSVDEAKSYLKDAWREEAKALADKYTSIFGKGNFYIEIQLIDHKALPASRVTAECLREIAKAMGLPCVATPDAHYPTKEDASDQRILLCSLLDVTLRQAREKMAANEDFMLGGFFRSSNYHIPSLEEMVELHTEEELRNTIEISDSVAVYDVFAQPRMPNFECPDGLTANEYLRQLCRQGWTKHVKGVVPKEKEAEYADRVKMELKVFDEAGLASYFLVVQDYCNYARNKGYLVGPGRGSGAGCLVSMLIGITDPVVDPIKYDLLFERFYNAGRNAPGRISLPDIDCDFPVLKRKDVKEYVRGKYGHDHTSEMITFNRMKGRSALKDVLKAHEACSFDEANAICQWIPKAETEIAADFQEMLDETGEASLIRWALENRADKLKEYCFIEEDGSLGGPYAKLFAQAIRLEDTKRGSGKHAGGVIISPTPLAPLCPMVHDKSSGRQMAGWEMNDLEAIGIPKFDILGVAVFDKVMGIEELLEFGDISDDDGRDTFAELDDPEE